MTYYSYSFRKLPANRVFKNKKCCFPDQGTWVIIPTNLLKKNLTHSSIFKTYFRKIFDANIFAAIFYQKQMQKQPFENNSQYSQGNTCYWSLFFNKVAGLQLFSWEYCKIFRSAFHRTPPVAASVDVLFYIIFLKRRCYIYYNYTLHFSFWNLKSLSFTFICSATRYHSFYNSLSFVVTRCTTCCTTRCHSLYHLLPFVVTRCYSLSRGVPLVSLFINDHFSSGVIIVTRS